MKQIVSAIIVIITLGITPAFAQEGYRVSAISVGSGESPITSGLAGTIQLTNEKKGFIEVTVQQEQMWFMMGKDFESKSGKTTCNLYWSVGAFQGAPWVGPYAGCTRTLGYVGQLGADGKKSQKVSVGVMTWPGFFFYQEPRDWREDGVENKEKLYAGYFSSASLSINRVSFSLAHLDFMDEKVNWLPGVAYTHKLRKDFEVTGNATFNTNDRRMMYLIGATWRP